MNTVAIPIYKPGLPNFYQVSDDLYRGAQPTREGFKNLKAMGIATVVNLRSFHTDCFYLHGLGFRHEHIWMKAWHPEREDVKVFCRIIKMAPKPVFVHCRHGADRTGTMCAVYRIRFQGWSKQDAVEEMTEGPFGFHEIWHNLEDFILDL